MDKKRYVWGNKTKKWYLVDKTDRDFKHGLSPKLKKKLGNKAKSYYLRPFFIKEPFGLPFELTEKDKFRKL